MNRWVFDWMSLGTIVAAFAGILPPLAALAGATYYGIQVWESKTMKDWRQQRRLQKVVRLEARVAALKAQVPTPPSLG